MEVTETNLPPPAKIVKQNEYHMLRSLEVNATFKYVFVVVLLLFLHFMILFVLYFYVKKKIMTGYLN